jgi:hypothetical protein
LNEVMQGLKVKGFGRGIEGVPDRRAKGWRCHGIGVKSGKGFEP